MSDDASSDWDRIREADPHLVGTTAHTSLWPRTVFIRPEDGKAAVFRTRENLDEAAISLDTLEELDRVILRLINIRALSADLPPTAMPAAIPLAEGRDVMVKIGRDPRCVFSLSIRTNGQPWVSYPLSLEQLEEMRRDLAATSQRPGAPTLFPRGGPA